MIELYNDDCLKVLGKIGDDTVDLIVTDPPYNLGEFAKSRAANLQNMRDNFFVAAGWDNVGYNEWKQLMNSFFKEAARVSKVGGSLLMFMSIMKLETIIEMAQEHGFYYKTVGVWHKTNPMPRNMNLHFINSTEPWLYFVYKKKTGTFNNDGKALHDFIETSVTPKREKECGTHPTQKPLDLIKFFVKTLSNDGDLVIDPFMGSGTSAVAAKELNRNFIGIELDENYYKIAKERINGKEKERGS
jgi:DNA modification methylase